MADKRELVRGKAGNAKRRERWLSAFGVNPCAGLARYGLSGSPRGTLFVTILGTFSRRE
jgi:hypothetical protein